MSNTLPNISMKSSSKATLDSLDSSIPLKITSAQHIDPEELFLVGDAFIDEKGLIGHHIDSANAFYTSGIKQIITEGFDIRKIIMNTKGKTTQEDANLERIECAVRFTDVRIDPPVTLNYITGKEVSLMPRMAALRDKIYSGPLYVSFDVEATAYLKSGEPVKRTDHVKNFRIANIPIIKGSVLCNTYEKPKEVLMQMGEDPTDPGGYFITKNEYAIDSTESTTFNQLKVYINEGYGKSRVRADFLSKPGDGWQNSDMIILIFNTDDTFTIEISRDKLMDVKIPFYMLFRAMGWSDDKQLFDHIIQDYDSEANKNILNNTIAAMNAKYGTQSYRDVYDQTEVLEEIVGMVPPENYAYLALDKHEENMQNAITDVLNTIDLHLLPHIGMTADHRVDKMKFLALMIRKVLMVYLRHTPQTDRDSYRIKRVHAAGDNAAKTFKQIFNQTAALPIKKQMTKVFNASPFSQINLGNLVKQAIYVEDFERLIVQTIIAGNKSSLKIKRRTVTNRLMAQLLHRKNTLNTWATMRQVSSTSADSAKQSERAAEMRRVHMSALGYICVSHSPAESEKVGINKQIAIFASIAPASSSEVLKKVILEDPDVIHDGQLSPLEIYRGNYAAIYVNGHLIAYTKDSIVLVDKYRKMRRRLELNPYTTIYWDNVQNEVLFFVDIGRMTRPLTIVYNNKRDPEVFSSFAKAKGGKSKNANAKSKSGKIVVGKDGLARLEDAESKLDKVTKVTKQSGKSGSGEEPFRQMIAITPQDILDLYTKKKGIYDLVREQKVEFITPEEQQNIYICSSLRKLQSKEFDDLNEYTHCDIPQAIMGITALTSPFANHNQAPRVTFQTSQAKQTCGYYVGNWPFRIDKEAFLQYISETPLVRTAVNKYVPANGNNLIVAIACYTGNNQEDSIIANKASIDRGVFNGCKMDFEKTELEQKEELGQPDSTKTDGIKAANYGKLIGGTVQPGTRLLENDVIIGKYMSMPKTQGNKNSFIDRSIVYKESEPAIVQNVVVDRNEDGLRFCKVGYRKIRNLVVGDKMCLLPTAEVLTNKGWMKIMDVDIENDLVATMDPKTFALSYVHAANKPIFDWDSEKDGELYYMKMQQLHTICTPNHKNFVKRYVRSKYREAEFELLEAKECFGKKLNYKKDCVNVYNDYATIHLPDADGIEHTYDLEAYLKLLGMFISDGYTTDDGIVLTMKKDRKRDYIRALEPSLGFQFSYTSLDRIRVGKAKAPGIYEEFKKLSVGCINKRLPDDMWHMGRENCRDLLDGLMNGDGCINCKGSWTYSTSSPKLADDVQRLVLHCGYTSNIRFHEKAGTVKKGVDGRIITSTTDSYTVNIIFTMNTPRINGVKCVSRGRKIPQEEKWIPYKGQVCCLEIPETHLFYYRENRLSPPMWTGNSSRAGQKAICGLLMDEADMPFTADGMRPDLIFNPHGLPSRMTCSQLLESLMGTVCAMRGVHYDATVFKSVDIETIAEQLEQLGMNRYGYDRMHNGMTGEFIDAEIFIGPVYYQRLQKFVSDAQYSVRHALTDAVTFQPLDGMASAGGLRLTFSLSHATNAWLVC